MAAADSGSSQVGSAPGEGRSKVLALSFWGPTKGASHLAAQLHPPPVPGCDQLVNSPVSLATAKGWGATCFRWDRNLPDLDRKLNWTSLGTEDGGLRATARGSRIPGSGPWCGPAPWRPQGPGPGPLPPELFFLTWPDSVSRGVCVQGKEREPCLGVRGRDQDQIPVYPWPDFVSVLILKQGCATHSGDP